MLLLLAVPARAGWLEEFAAGKFAVVDLTHTLAMGMPSFSGQPNYLQEMSAEYKRAFKMNSLLMLEHAGTHMDAPVHFAEGGAAMEAVPAKDLVAPAVVVDFRARSARDPDATLGVEDLAAWERNLGRIPNGAFVILWTGWSDRWATPDRYRNADSSSVLHFPGFSKAAADWLLKERQAAGLGTDTLSADSGIAGGGVVYSTSTAVFSV
ncbi:MAG: cyclase family protein, partial [bacterium]